MLAILVLCCTIALQAQASRKKTKKSTTVAVGTESVAVAKPKPAAAPFWTEGLDQEVDAMAKLADADADDIMANDSPEQALHKLLGLARRKDGVGRNAVMARFMQVEQRASLAPEQLYLMLREADGMDIDVSLRRKLILALGKTRTIQVLPYLRKYYGNGDYADAMALATTDVIGAHPEANAGTFVYDMLYNAKKSFIRHYGEQNVDTYIDNILATTDNWRAKGGYDMNHTEETRMEKRGFWVMHDELQDFDFVFDWKADGVLTLSLRSVPVLMFDRNRGVCLVGQGTWHKAEDMGEWATANVSMNADNISVAVNGIKLIDAAKLQGNAAIGKPGFVKFLADDLGATVRGYCFMRK